MLMDYFALNQRDPEARMYTYGEIPSYFVFQKNTPNRPAMWKKRLRHFNVIGRMYSISPRQIELFHLRLLLLTIKGATSFEDLRTVNNVVHDTYHGACVALGLIEDDSEWDRAMTEGEIWMMPRQLRHLFVRILIYCQPNNPNELWENFKDALSEDFKHKGHSETQSYARAYHEINTLLGQENSSVSQFPSMPSLAEFEKIDDINDEGISLQNHEQIGLAQYAKLNGKQKQIVDEILNAALSKQPTKTCFYIDGLGGSGKTFVYNTIYQLLKSKGYKIATMAFTGIAAILLPQGRTMHKVFGMPVPMFADSTSNFRAQSKEARELLDYDILICDEAPMAPRYCIELADRTYRDLTKNELPFGGKIMLMGGDFRQLLPVKVNGSRSETVNLSIKFSHLWKHFKVFSLTENMRTLPGEAEFAKYLLDVGNGILNDNDNNLLAPENCVASKDDDIVRTIFRDLIDNHQYDDLTKVSVLAARHVDVDEINSRVIELLDHSTEKIYTGMDSTENCDNGDIDDVILPEYLSTLNPPNFPPYELKLRLHCIVMLLRNLSPSEGLCNGTRLQILDLSNNLLKCRILTGNFL
ncbi:ATP-dependent DNA helicase PIF1-like [Aphidius gifuensis]|uniref:ATP-dependent DNA helicase PIF1-like n=1 Tax=Aphidius gifuensis TaxID=684658 RepID=UPI001CDD6C67|nr:ATP-dependent DNA helicase PIF1-like [Aphidius gifuensis]